MNMRFPAFTLAATLALAVGGARADMAFAYHGKLVRADARPISRTIPMAMEFRLCASETPDGSSPLWGRCMSVRFNNDGLFYVELRDSAGTALDDADYRTLPEAVAAAGTNAWISVTPVGYGELLPRKRLGGVHRAERAGCVSRAGRVAVPTLKVDAAEVRELVVRGTLSVTDSFTAGGGQIVYAITSAEASLGMASGTVLFSGTFDNWRTFDNPISDAAGRVGADTLLAYPASSAYGVFSIPLPRESATASLPQGGAIKASTFANRDGSPFF